ncbi:hypothetical protein U0X36_04875 [Bacillus thuringiensis]|uniref:hypothetical protein n=1 Tax=Bacillus thuringiensis TaxID=1428 RepID=UPI000E52B138|nr:hypothetical protein [Bacillus thuringiensis]MDZ3952287.1 hypothetical protein [Bacillus thuringiensis]RGP53430.1 hypothetical protein BTW32_09875 [Bacillus thuringiensis]
MEKFIFLPVTPTETEEVFQNVIFSIGPIPFRLNKSNNYHEIVYKTSFPIDGFLLIEVPARRTLIITVVLDTGRKLKATCRNPENYSKRFRTEEIFSFLTVEITSEKEFTSNPEVKSILWIN